MAIIIDMNLNYAVIMSALIAVMYTWIGGLYSVAYTDVVQLGCIAIGLVMCIPFAWNHEAVRPITMDSEDWIGSVTPGQELYYADYFLLLTFGGIPWQVRRRFDIIGVYLSIYIMSNFYFCTIRSIFNEYCPAEPQLGLRFFHTLLRLVVY